MEDPEAPYFLLADKKIFKSCSNVLVQHILLSYWWFLSYFGHKYIILSQRMSKKYYSNIKLSLLEGIGASFLLFPNKNIYTNVSTVQYILFEILPYM